MDSFKKYFNFYTQLNFLIFLSLSFFFYGSVSMSTPVALYVIIKLFQMQIIHIKILFQISTGVPSAPHQVWVVGTVKCWPCNIGLSWVQ